MPGCRLHFELMSIKDFYDLNASSCMCHVTCSVKDICASLSTDQSLSNSIALQNLQFLTDILNNFVNIVNGEYGVFSSVCTVLNNEIAILRCSQPLEDYLIEKIMGEDKLLQYAASKTFDKLCVLDEKWNRLPKLELKVFKDCDVNHLQLLGFMSFLENSLTKPSYLSQEGLQEKPVSQNECQKKCAFKLDDAHGCLSFDDYQRRRNDVLIQHVPTILSSLEDATTANHEVVEQLRMSIFRVFRWILDGKSGNNLQDWLLNKPISILNLFVKTSSKLAWEKGAFLVHKVIDYRCKIALENNVTMSACQFTRKTLGTLLEDETLGNMPTCTDWRGFGGCEIAINNEEEYEKFGNSEFIEASKPLLQNVCLCVLASLATQAKSLCSCDGFTSDDLSVKGLITIAEQFDRHFCKHLTYVWQTGPNWIIELFKDQDDALFAALLYCLDFEISLKRCECELGPLLQHWNAQCLFARFVEAVGCDHSVVMDLVISEETCFLLYLLRYLKLCNQVLMRTCKSKSSRTVSLVDYDSSDQECVSGDFKTEDFHVVCNTLHRLADEIEKLHSKSLFPYNPSPLLTQLKRYVALVCADA